MIERVLFLDVDGVLCTEHGEDRGLNSACLEQLSRIKRATQCVLVLTSSWRKSAQLSQRLSESSVKYFSQTPDFSKPSDRHGAVHREREIKAWLERCYVPQFAILDDCEEVFQKLKEHLFLTRFRTGLTAEIADRVTDYLTAERP